MTIGLRRPSLKKSPKASTTGRATRAMRRTVIPGCGRPGMDFLRDPRRAARSAVDPRTTLSLWDRLR